MNILFSDAFIERFANLDNKKSRAELDDLGCANNETFWRDVRNTFVCEDADVHEYKFDDEELARLNMDLKKVVNCNSKRLQKTWTETNKNYKEAL